MKALIVHVITLAVSLSFAGLAGADAMKPIDPASYDEPVKVACIGDSITKGAGAKPGKSYPSQLQEMLGERWKVLNFGVSGRTLLKKGDHPYWQEKVYQDALGSEPDVVIIMLGTNDSKPQNWEHKAEFEADYRELVASFQKLESKPRIYVCRPCPVVEGKGDGYGIREAPVLEQIVIINKLAEEMGVGLIDMHAALENFPEMLPDRVHPNGQGAGKMAAAAFTALNCKAAH